MSDVQCKTCDTLVGTKDNSAEGYRVFKWAIALATGEEGEEKFEIQQWVSAQLLAAIQNLGVRKFIVKEEQSRGEAEVLMVPRSLSHVIESTSNFFSSGYSHQTSASRVPRR